MILMTLTSIASRQQLKVRILIQEISMMEKRIRELEKTAERQMQEKRAKQKEENRNENGKHSG